MTPGIELAERIEQAQILVIVHARDIFADRTAQRHHAQPLRPFGGKGLDLGTRRSPFEELPIPPLTDREARWRGATSACASASLSAKLDSMPTRRTTAAC